MSLVRKIFITASIACGASWLTKIVFAFANDGEESLAIGITYVLGMASFLIAAGTGVALLLRSTPIWLRVTASVLAVPVAFAALDLLGTLVKSVYQGDGWFRSEVALVISGVVLAGIGLSLLARGSGRDTSDSAGSVPSGPRDPAARDL